MGPEVLLEELRILRLLVDLEGAEVGRIFAVVAELPLDLRVPNRSSFEGSPILSQSETLKCVHFS